VARTRSPAVAKRNETIYAQWRRGASLTALGEHYGISRQVVARIVASFHPELEEGEDRAIYRGEMWRLYDEVEAIAQAPGFKMSPNGQPARLPDGELATDTTTALQARDLQLKVITELRKMDGRDRPSQRNVTVSIEVAEQQRVESLARLRAEKEAEDRRRAAEIARLEGLRVIRGEVEPPAALPPAAAAEG
jgi:hypothetical protein